MFKPALSIQNDLKLHMEVKYPAQYEISTQYKEIGLRFTEYFDSFIMPSEDKFLHGEGLPTVGNVKFRASATNYVEFKNFFEVIKHNQVWVAMRLHELIHLQLQFYPQKQY